MYFILCDGTDNALSRWAELIRNQAEQLSMDQKSISVMASNKWDTPAVGRQVWQRISQSSDRDNGVLVLSSDAWRSLLYSLPKPVPMDSGRVRFTMTIESGDLAVGIKMEVPRPTPQEVLELLNWLKREVEIHAGIRPSDSRAE